MSALLPTLPTRKPSNPATAVLATAALIAILYYGRVFLITVVISLIIAFLLDPLVGLFVRLRLPRGLAAFVVCAAAIVGLYLVGLGAYTEIAGLAEDLPRYSGRINAMVDSVATRVDDAENKTIQLVVPKRFRGEAQQGPAQPTPGITTATGPVTRGRRRAAPPVQPVTTGIPEVRIHEETPPLFSYLYGYLRNFYDVLLMASFVPFLVYFMLSWRDHLRRTFLYLFSGAERQVAARTWEGVADIARAYVIGNFVLGVMLSTFSSAFFFSIGMPYWLLVGILSGFLSLVPYVGLPLAVLPPVLAGIAIYNEPAIYLLIALIIVVLHLIALNLLYPKIVGARVHLNPLVVTVALMFWGTIWGGIGLLLAVPITAGIKAVCDNVTGLEAYGKFLGD
ncbi:MAG TPA: AI-2E family transporter [Bryobacteraceae bacterium]|jgi:predicted PurR-regulated permease PerM|nr:AI-2E family transporter [Bryobacteraceae bacterium]